MEFFLNRQSWINLTEKIPSILFYKVDPLEKNRSPESQNPEKLLIKVPEICHPGNRPSGTRQPDGMMPWWGLMGPIFRRTSSCRERCNFWISKRAAAFWILPAARAYSPVIFFSKGMQVEGPGFLGGIDPLRAFPF